MGKQPTYDVSQAAMLVNACKKTIYRALQSNDLKGAKVGLGNKGKWVISRVELEKWWRAKGGGDLFEEAG